MFKILKLDENLIAYLIENKIKTTMINTKYYTIYEYTKDVNLI